MQEVESQSHTQQEKGRPLFSETAEVVKSYRSIPKNDSSPFELSETKSGDATAEIKKGSVYNIKKIGLITSLVIILVGVASFCAIYFTMDHSKIQIQLIREGSGVVQGQQITNQQHSVILTYEDNTQEEMTLFTVTQKDVPTGRFLGEDGTTQETTDHTCYYGNIKDSTENQARVCDSINPKNPDIVSYDAQQDGVDLIKQIKSSLNEADSDSRFLESDGEGQPSDSASTAAKANSIIEDLRSEEGIDLSFNQQQEIDINDHRTTYYGTDAPIITQKVQNLRNPNAETNIDDGQVNDNSQKRILFRIKIKKIFTHVVKQIKQNGPKIFATIGAVYGAGLGISRGGLYEGIQTSSQIAISSYQKGVYPQKVAKDCFPDNRTGGVKFKCNLKKLAIDTAIEFIPAKIEKEFKIVAKFSAHFKLKW